MKNFDKKILTSIGKKLLQNKQTVAVAESVTTGLLQFAIGGINDASQFLQGGATLYNLGQKFKQLGVEPIHALQVNCVSQKVATEMAAGICRLFQSDWGIAITGYATPVPESDKKLFAFYAIVFRNKVLATGKLTSPKQTPASVQYLYISSILSKWEKLLRLDKSRKKSFSKTVR